MYYLSSYVADTYFTSWVYVVKDWSVSKQWPALGVAVSVLDGYIFLQTRNYNFYINA
jgi:hypothetical protein